MVKAEGIIDFIYKPVQIQDYKKETTYRIKSIKNKFRDKFKIISISPPYESLDEIVVTVSCRFTIHLPNNPHCKIVDDYVGYVFPALAERLSTQRILSTKIKQLSSDNGKIKSTFNQLNNFDIK
ncbi:hypothetical protein [Neobacillus cucumis]|uniref:Uncharacterized protein n=1 Tax=Neobacillus cucumis TaxID=1740721 RepID=A0A2N5HV95_9BACI|nr:hypothetical protein [Neobacillus cucumis]PLS09448.1 hypothetical protein CVD27_00945 [Neobacillus cucumis]